IVGATEVLRADPGDDLRLQRSRGVVQLGQLRLVGRREEVGPRREDLTELDEGRTELREGAPDVLRPRQRLLVVAVEDALKRNEPLETGDADNEAEPVPREHLAHLAVTAGLRLGSDGCQPNKLFPAPFAGEGQGGGRRYRSMEVEVLSASVLDRVPGTEQDRKSTRLNSSHLVISYAVFCLKKKKTK